jgi:hypothetical protein
MARWEWLRGFRARHADICLRRPEATLSCQPQAFDQPQIKTLEEVMLKYEIHPSRVRNFDDSAPSTMQKLQKASAVKGKRQVGSITSAERGRHVTAVCYTCTAKSFIPQIYCMQEKDGNMRCWMEHQHEF